jgi:hypothetical protein
MPQNLIDKIKDLSHDPIGIGILLSASLAIISFILTSISLVQQNSQDDTPVTDPNIEVNTEVPGDPGSVGDLVWLDLNRDGIYDIGEQGMAGLTVNLIDIKAAKISNTIITDGQGKFEFTDVTPGEYEIEIQLPLNLIATKLESGENRETDSNITLLENSNYGVGRVGKTNSFIVDSGQRNLSIDAGVHTFEEIRGVTWVDNDGDRRKTETDTVAEGIIVSLLGENEEVIDSKVTGNDGIYVFTSMQPGKYTIKFESNQDYSTQDPIKSTATLQQITSTPQYTEVIELQAEQKIGDINQQMYQLTSEIKLQIVNRERSGENPTTVVEETPEITTAVTEQPTATATLEEIPSQETEPTSTIETQNEESTGSGTSADPTVSVQSSGSSNLVRTGLPIFILAALGGINLFMLKFANTDKSETDMRKRRARRYSNRM